MLALLLALSVSACASLGPGAAPLRLAPDGLALGDHVLRAALASESYGSALSRLDERHGAPGDRLLSSMYRGLVAYYAGTLDDGAAAL